MKILIVGENRYPIYEKAFKKAFRELGHQCEIFGWNKYFAKDKILNKLENKFLIGPSVKKINIDLIKTVKSYCPDLIFMYRPVMILPETLNIVKLENDVKIFTYHNDDPFSKRIPKYMNRHFIASLPHCDWLFSYRQKNINDYRKLGYENVSLLRSYYLKENNFYIPNSEKVYDVVFIGHFEDDGRDQYILHLLNNNVNVKIFGTNWEASNLYDDIVKKAGFIEAVYGGEYNLIINQAKIALVFLSRLNNDTYTRRCFEIPATKTAMFSVYTNDLVKNLFTEKVEIEYFRNKDELLTKTVKYLASHEKYDELGINAYKRLVNDGHEVKDRVKTIIEKYIEVS